MHKIIGHTVIAQKWSKEGKGYIDYLIGEMVSFGVDSEQVEYGAITYTTAIILDGAGKFHNVAIELVRLKPV